MNKTDTAAGATYCAVHASDFLIKLLEGAVVTPECVVVVAQLPSDEGSVNVAVSWPREGERALLDAAAVAREAGDVLERAAGEQT